MRVKWELWDVINFHIPRVSDFDFMAIINLRIYMGFERENRRGVTLHPQSLFMVKYLINSQICYPHKIRIAITKVMKICKCTRIRVLNVNLGSEISYDAGQRNFEKSQN